MKILEEIKKLCLSRYNLFVIGVQVAIYVLLVSIWSLVIMLLEHDVKAAKESMCVNSFVLFLLLIVFMVNFYLLVPYLFETKNKTKHWAFLDYQPTVHNFVEPPYLQHIQRRHAQCSYPSRVLSVWCDVDDSQLCNGRCGNLRALLYPP